MAIKNLDTDSVKDTHYDICIIGSGPAGLTLCAELVNSGKKVVVLESGGLTKEAHTHELKKVTTGGEITIKPSSRERIVGGTSTAWAGLSAPLDPVDFEKWPLEKGALDPYYKKVSAYGFSPIQEFDSASLDNLRASADFTLRSDALDEKIFIAKDPAWNFGKELKHIFNNEHIDLITHATTTHISSVKNGEVSSVDKIIVTNSNGEKSVVSATKFILAAGGIESVRLLLLSRNTCQYGLGNEHDQVGRYVMNHPKNNFGIIKLNQPVKNLTYLFGYLHKGWAKSAGVRVHEKLQKRLGILNSYVRLEPMFPWTDSEGVAHLIGITKKMKLFLDWWKKLQKKIVGLRDWNETGDDVKTSEHFSWITSFFHVVKDIRTVCIYIFYRLFQNKEIPIKTIRLRNFMEMEPCADNRITLSDSKDIYNNELAHVHMTTTELDRRSLIELHKTIATELTRKKIGKLESNLDKVEPWPIHTEASHHLGGTIMGIDPKTSVVNTQLKVHSVDNLYVASGSVFPTSGCANPTQTICALSVRLAEELRRD